MDKDFTGKGGGGESTLRIPGRACIGRLRNTEQKEIYTGVVPLAGDHPTAKTSEVLPDKDSVLVQMGLAQASKKQKVTDSRQDFPAIYNKNRGSSVLAIAVAADTRRLEQAKLKLFKDFYAAGSWRTMTAQWKVVAAILSAAHFVVFVPVTVDAVYTVAASMKEGGFRSGAQYLGVLKIAHLEANHAISPALELAWRKSEDSLARGLGPANKAPEIKLSWLCFDVDLFLDLPVIGGPDSYVVAFCWVLREIEVAALLAHPQDISLKDNGDVELTLQVTKCDTEAQSVTRSLACSCWLHLAAA